MGNKRNASKGTKRISEEAPPRKDDQARRWKLEEAFLKLCGVRKEYILGKDKFLDQDRIFNLGHVLRWIRPKLLPRDADVVQTILTKLPLHTGQKSFTITAADIALLATVAKTIPNVVILSIMDKGNFQHPMIDEYLARHPKERIHIPGQDKPSTWEELNDCESGILTKLESLQSEGGILSSLETSIIYVRYREHFLAIKCVCCGTGGADSARHFIGQGSTRKGFVKLWESIASGERCRMNKMEIEEVYSFCKETPDVYAIKSGEASHWPLQIDMEELEFQQGLEDLKALVRLEDAGWEEFTTHGPKTRRNPHSPSHEIWESTTQKNSAPASSFADPELKDAVDNLDCDEQAHMFKHWIDEYPPEVTDALVLSSRSMTDLFRNVGRKLRDAEDHFRRTRGGNEPIILKAIEAVSIHRSYVSLGRKLGYAERQIRLQETSLAMRNSVVHGLTHLYLLYQKKVQELLWITNTKKFYLYGDALEDQNAAGKELSRLKVHYELQTTKLDLLQEELNLVAAMNYAAQRRIETLEDVVKSIGGPCSHSDVPVKPDCTNWHAIEKDIETRKQAIYRSIKKSVASQIDAQSLKGSQDWDFLQLLFDHVLEKDPKVVEKFAQEVYGGCIGIIHQSLAPGRSCKEFLCKIKPQIGGAEVDQKLVEELCLATGWRTYLPAHMTDCCHHSDTKWIPMYEMDVVQDELNDSLQENEVLIDELEECQDIRDTAIQEAQKWRECFDLHLLDCKKESVKADAANSRFHKWTDETCRLLAPDEQIPPLKPEKEKLAFITERILEIAKERDVALGKNKPLLNQIVRKDKVIDEKTRELARALESRGAREESLSLNITKLESMLENKRLEVEKARKDVDKVKEEWNKKIQRGHDKVATLEDKLKAKAAEFDTMKLDYEATQSQLERSKKDAAQYKKQLKEINTEFTSTKRERDESKMALRTLRSNAQAENDRLKKAVRDAVVPKDALLAQLKKEIEKLNHDRVSDEANIRELSQLNNEYKQKDLDLAAYQSHATAMEELHEANTREVRDLRAKVASMEALYQWMGYGEWTG